MTNNTISFTVSESANITATLPTPFEVMVHAGLLGKAGAEFGNDIVLLSFAGQELPTWAGFVAQHKASMKANDAAINAPNKRSHSALYQQFNLGSIIASAVAEGFEPLAAWNEVASTKKRETRPSLSLIAKMAKSHMRGEKPVKSPMDKVNADLVTLYQHMLDLPNGKASQDLLSRVVAIASLTGAALVTGK